jgi:lysophospholipase L1-like esterase
MSTSKKTLSLKRKILYSVVTVTVLLFLMIGAGEVAGQLYVRARYGVPGKSYGIYMADKELGATHRPNSYNSNSVINNWGFRNVEDIQEMKPHGAMRIYCSGGSTTFCYNLSTEEAWPVLLQKKLRQVKNHERDEVLNAGQICFAVGHEYALARRLIPRLKPDVVIIYTGINEVLAEDILIHGDGANLDQLLAEQRWGVFPRELDQARFLKRHSVLVRMWDYRLKNWLEPVAVARYRQTVAPPASIHPWVIKNFEHTLRSYLTFLKEKGCRAVIVRWSDNGVDNWHLEVAREFRDRAVGIGREFSADIADMVSIVESDQKRERLFIASGVHVTKEGAEVVSDALMKMLLGPEERGQESEPRPSERAKKSI